MYLDVTRTARTPYSPSSGAPGQHTFQRIGAASGTEAHNPRALKQGVVHAIVVGATPIRVEFRGSAGLAAVVDGSVSFRIPANSTFYFVPGLQKNDDGTINHGSIYVYGENEAATASAWEAFIYQAGL